MKTYLLLMLSLLSLACTAQKLTFRQRTRVYINGYSDSFPVKYINKDTDTVLKKTNKIYSATGDLLTYQTEAKPNWSKGIELSHNSIHPLPEELQKRHYIFTDIKAEEDRLNLYPWPFGGDENTAVNSFFRNNLFSIELKERINLSVKHDELIAGVLTLPFKAWLGGPDSVSKIQTSANVGLYFGYKWGFVNYRKLPNESEYTNYLSGWSITTAWGLTKTDLDEKNTKDAGKKFKGSIASLSGSINLGYHYKTFSVFVALGRDIPLESKGSNWTLKNKHWLGFGAGFEIF